METLLETQLLWKQARFFLKLVKHFLWVMSNDNSSNKEYRWVAEEHPAVKPLSEYRADKQHKQTQNCSNYSTPTISEDKPTSDDSLRRKQLPPIAKSTLYKTKMCRNYMNNGRCKYGRVCQFAHGRKELMKYSLCVCWRDSWVEQRQQCTTRFLFRGQLTIVLLTGMTAFTEDEDNWPAIKLKPLLLVVRRASQSANTNTSNNAPFTLSEDALILVVRPRVYLEEVTMR